MDLETHGRVEKEGYLIKEGSLVKNLKNRFFVLCGNETSAALFYYESPEKTKRLGALVISADSSISEIEDVQRDNSTLSSFALTTPERVLHVFGAKLYLEDWAHTISGKIHSLRYIRSLNILLDKIFKAKAESSFLHVAVSLCLHLRADEDLVVELLNELGYDATSSIKRSELSLFFRRFQPLIAEDEVPRLDSSVHYKLSSILHLLKQPWFSGFEDASEQEERILKLYHPDKTTEELSTSPNSASVLASTLATLASSTSQNSSQPGTFAVRFSSSYMNFFAICASNGKTCDHWRLMVTPRGYEVEEFISFETVSEVVAYYALHTLPDSKIKLKIPSGISRVNLPKILAKQQKEAEMTQENGQNFKRSQSLFINSNSHNIKPATESNDQKEQQIGQTNPVNISANNIAVGSPPPPDIQSFVGTSSFVNRYLESANEEPPLVLSNDEATIPVATQIAEPSIGWSPSNSRPAITVDWTQVKLREKLGSGGSGMNVYRATVSGFTCAVKVMEVNKFRPDQIRHFEEEINMLRLVSESPHIVKYLHHTVSATEIRLFMEYLPSSLFDVIKQKRTTGKHFSAYTVALVSLEIIKGIHYLHSHDPPILMRDIKSANVFVSVSNADQFVDIKVGDFGVSREVSSNDKAMTFIGTPGWMCPTIIAMKGKKRKPGEPEDPNAGYTVSVDIFAFGMVMYELLAMKQPYSKETDIFGLVKRGVRPELPPLDARYAELIRIHHACIAFEPAERPTAKQLLVQLASLVQKIAPRGPLIQQ